MVIDFIAKINNVNYNVKLAKIFGVYSAIFINLLIDYHFRAEDGYIKLARVDIYNLTGIEEDKQIEVEENLVSCNLIQVNKLKNSSSKNYYNLNMETLNKILISDDLTNDEGLKQTLRNAPKAPKTTSKRSNIINSLKSCITVEDEKSREYLKDWVDAVMQKSGYLSKVGVECMCEDLIKYSDKKVTLLRDLCKLAAKLGYKDSKWVIKNYQDNQIVSNNLSLTHDKQVDIDENISKLKNYAGDTF